jgi:tetratricopeptide (TPR) repeat protein
MVTYTPFVVRIDPPADGAYPVSAEFRGLQAQSSIPVDALRQILVDHVAGRGRIGSRLFALLFTGPVLTLHTVARGWLTPNERLRIVLSQPLPDPLAALPWELIFDAPVEPRSLANTENAPLVRYASVAALPHDPPRRGALRVLAVTWLPADAAVEEGVAALARAPSLRDMAQRLAADLRSRQPGEARSWLLRGRRYEVTVLDHPSLEELSAHVAEAEAAGAGYHLAHFFTQASQAGEILLPQGPDPIAIPPERLATLAAGPSLMVLALTICQAQAAGNTVGCAAQAATEAGVPATVGWQVPQFDAGLVDFSREFYRALSAGQPIELALAYARRLVAQLRRDAPSLPLPALYMGHTGGLTLSSLERARVVPRAWRLVSWFVATALAIAGTTAGILDLPSFPRMLRERAPVIRCLYPNPMNPNKLTVAFLPLSVVDERGNPRISSAGHDVAQFLYERFEPALADLELGFPHEIRSPEFACALPGRTAEERAATAIAYAERVNADILVYGVITDTAKADRLALAFQVSYQGFENGDEVSGPYALGGSLPVSLPFDPESLLVIEHPPHLVRMNVLAELVVGLSYLRADNPEKALTYIRMAESDPHWPNADGKEFAYLLLGHALIRQASVANAPETSRAALEAYDRALEIAPDYTRAEIGRAGALAMLSLSARDSAGRRELDQAQLDQAAAAYQAALNRASSSVSIADLSSAHTGLGYVYILRGLYGKAEDLALARAELKQVTDAYEAGDQGVAKNAGLAYGYLGLLARQSGDVAAAVSYYAIAVDLVAPMSRALYLYRLGELTCQQGDREGALRLYAQAVDESRLYGRAAEVDEFTKQHKALQSGNCP